MLSGKQHELRHSAIVQVPVQVPKLGIAVAGQVVALSNSCDAKMVLFTEKNLLISLRIALHLIMDSTLLFFITFKRITKLEKE